MNGEGKEAAIIQNMKDAGCGQKMIAAFVETLREDKADEGMRLLAAHRRMLLEELHREQKKIDCLDYLVYQMQKLQKSKMTV